MGLNGLQREVVVHWILFTFYVTCVQKLVVYPVKFCCVSMNKKNWKTSVTKKDRHSKSIVVVIIADIIRSLRRVTLLAEVVRTCNNSSVRSSVDWQRNEDAVSCMEVERFKLHARNSITQVALLHNADCSSTGRCCLSNKTTIVESHYINLHFLVTMKVTVHERLTELFAWISMSGDILLMCRLCVRAVSVWQWAVHWCTQEVWWSSGLQRCIRRGQLLSVSTSHNFLLAKLYSIIRV